MDAVGVGAVSWSGDVKVVDVDVLAPVKVHVECFAVDEFKQGNRRIANFFELQCLNVIQSMHPYIRK